MTTSDIALNLAQIHRQSVTAPLSEVAGHLQDLLSRRLTAVIAGVNEGKTVSRWASGEITVIRDPFAEQRLRTAYEISLLLLEHDSPQTVRAWFIGLDPQLGDESPAIAIREGRLQDVLAAARMFAFAG